jgi:hypothetical protein
VRCVFGVAFDRALGIGHDGAWNREGVREYKTGDRDPSRLIGTLTWRVRKQSTSAKKSGRNDVWDMREHRVFDIGAGGNCEGGQQVGLRNPRESCEVYKGLPGYGDMATTMYWDALGRGRSQTLPADKEETRTRQGLTLVIRLAGEVGEQWAVKCGQSAVMPQTIWTAGWLCVDPERKRAGGPL